MTPALPSEAQDARSQPGRRSPGMLPDQINQFGANYQ
jgi:hypothetical protein